MLEEGRTHGSLVIVFLTWLVWPNHFRLTISSHAQYYICLLYFDVTNVRLDVGLRLARGSLLLLRLFYRAFIACIKKSVGLVQPKHLLVVVKVLLRVIPNRIMALPTIRWISPLLLQTKWYPDSWDDMLLLDWLLLLLLLRLHHISHLWEALNFHCARGHSRRGHHQVIMHLLPKVPVIVTIWISIQLV